MGHLEIAKPFTTIVADPPWYLKGGGRIKRGADRHYPLMKTPAIIELMTSDEIPYLSMVNEEHSALFIWVINNFLEDGLELMRAMGYRYITNLVWVKTRFGTGYYFHGQHELVLFGVKGKWKRLPKVSGMNSTFLGGKVLDWKGREHSEKPPELQNMIERRLPDAYLEIFARRTRPGWTCWGNEVDDDQPEPPNQLLIPGTSPDMIQAYEAQRDRKYRPTKISEIMKGTWFEVCDPQVVKAFVLEEPKTGAETAIMSQILKGWILFWHYRRGTNPDGSKYQTREKKALPPEYWLQEVHGMPGHSETDH